MDIIEIAGPSDFGFYPEFYQEGNYTDFWGCTWTNIQAGIVGEVKNHILRDDARLNEYKAPVEQFNKIWEESKEIVENAIAGARKRGLFVMGGWISVFERMQFLRGTEELYCDIALKDGTVEKLAAIVMDFYRAYLEKWLQCDIDAVVFGDDWGSQISTLVNPADFRTYFKPCYEELCALVKKAGKKIFFHSDGWIFDLYDDLLSLGIDALNTQVWVMGIDRVAEKLAGKVTLWGEMDRQHTMPSGTSDEVRCEAKLLKSKFATKSGGFIGHGTVMADVSLDNTEAMFEAWNN
jgi:uroporphyrinogen decarboxylase